MIIPRSNDIIKHERFSDVAVLVGKVYRFDHKWKVKGTWINQGFTETWSLGIKARFNIPSSKLTEWLLCADPGAKCVRKCEWKYLGIVK